MASDEWIFLHALHAKILAKQKALRKEPSTPPEPLKRTLEATAQMMEESGQPSISITANEPMPSTPARALYANSEAERMLDRLQALRNLLEQDWLEQGPDMLNAVDDILRGYAKEDNKATHRMLPILFVVGVLVGLIIPYIHF